MGPALHANGLGQLIRLQRLVGNRAATRQVATLQRDDPPAGADMSAGRAAAREHVGTEQLEALLRNIPVDTPEEVRAAENMFGHVLTVLDGGAMGATGAQATPIPLAGAPFNQVALARALQEGKVGEVIASILPVVGDTALAVKLITDAGLSMGALTSGAGLSTSSVVATTAGGIAELAGPAALAVAVMVGVLSIPGDVNEDLRKIFYIGDVSGILTSWIWADPTISPHQQLAREAPTAGMFDTDISDAVQAARENAERVWAAQFRGQTERIRATRAAVGGDYQSFWLALGAELEAQLQPSFEGTAVSNIRRLIRGVELRRRREQRDRQRREREERFRREGGTIITEDGLVLTILGSSDVVDTP